MDVYSNWACSSIFVAYVSEAFPCYYSFAEWIGKRLELDCTWQKPREHLTKGDVNAAVWRWVFGSSAPLIYSGISLRKVLEHRCNIVFFPFSLSHSFEQWFARHISSSPQVTSLAFSIFMCVFLCNLDFEFDNLCDISSDFWAFDICSDRNENEFSTKVCVVCIVWNWCLYVDSLTLYRIVSYNTETGNGRILKQNMLEKEKWRENEMDTSELMKKIIHTQAKRWTWGRILPNKRTNPHYKFSFKWLVSVIDSL